jgi:hypothetical protein
MKDRNARQHYCPHKSKYFHTHKKHLVEVRYINLRGHHLNRSGWTTGEWLQGRGADQEGPDVVSARDRLSVGADLLIDNIQLLVASAGGIALNNNGGVNLIKMRDIRPRAIPPPRQMPSATTHSTWLAAPVGDQLEAPRSTSEQRDGLTPRRQPD